MTFENNNNTLIINDITKDELDLDKTFNCGQAFRWNKLEGGQWYGVVDNKILVLKQLENCIVTNLKPIDKDWLISYLNLDMNYTEEMLKINIESDEYLQKAYKISKGIHILRQDLYEMIITFIISQMNSMYNIRNCVNKLSKEYGEPLYTKLEGGTELKCYSFPTAEKIISLEISELRQCSVGFRDKYIYKASEFINSHPSFLNELKELDYNTAMKVLMGFDGIGNKVANCICLFGLHHIQAFPIDTHIKQIINNHYNGSLDIKKFGNIAGIVQQYMFYYKAFCKEIN